MADTTVLEVTNCTLERRGEVAEKQLGWEGHLKQSPQGVSRDSTVQT